MAVMTIRVANHGRSWMTATRRIGHDTADNGDRADNNKDNNQQRWLYVCSTLILFFLQCLSMGIQCMEMSV